MDNLFVLYRYLVQSKHLTDENVPYNCALRALNTLLEILRTLDYYGNEVRDRGGLDFTDAELIEKNIVEGYAVGLFSHHGESVKEMLVAIVEKYLPLEDFDFVIANLERAKKAAERRKSLDDLGEIDEHPF